MGTRWHPGELYQPWLYAHRIVSFYAQPLNLDGVLKKVKFSQDQEDSR
jgi:hypothetical protein